VVLYHEPPPGAAEAKREAAKASIMVSSSTRIKTGRQVVLYHEPPPGAAEAKREAAKASIMVEHRADDAGGYSTTRVDAKDQGFERSRA
jgi:hypothetical protein